MNLPMATAPLQVKDTTDAKKNGLINSEGVITDITVIPANIDERGPLCDLILNKTGMAIADKRLIGAAYKKIYNNSRKLIYKRPCAQTRKKLAVINL
jgi:hypothetical protein